MPISASCPQCGSPNQFPDHLAGQAGQCTACGGWISLTGGYSAPANPFSAQPAPGVQPFPGQQYPGQQYPGQQYPGQAYQAPQPGYGLPPQGYQQPRPASGGGGTTVAIVLAVIAGVLLLGCAGVSVLLIPAVGAARDAAKTAQSMNNMKQMGLAMHNYHDVFMALPYAGSEDPKQGLGLSWRVRILPYMEEGRMYDQFNFKEPWDSPTNNSFVNQMPRSYQSPLAPPSTSQTVYQMVVDGKKFATGAPAPPPPHTLFGHDNRVTRFHDVLDGTSNTVMIVEADPAQAVTWTQPKDIEFDPSQPKRGLATTRRGNVVLMADGSVRTLSPNTDDEVVRRIMYRNDGQPVTLDP